MVYLAGGFGEHIKKGFSILPLVLVHDWLPLLAQFLGPSISNKQRIQWWITVGVKSIAAGLRGTAIDYESVLVSRALWWRKGEGRQRREEGKCTAWMYRSDAY